MLSKERSFNRLCTLIEVAEDSDETAAEINDLLNELYVEYSELKIFRAVTVRLSRSGYCSKNRKVIQGAASRRHTRQRDHQHRVDEESRCAVQASEEAVPYRTSPSNNVLEFARYEETIH